VKRGWWGGGGGGCTDVFLDSVIVWQEGVAWLRTPS